MTQTLSFEATALFYAARSYVDNLFKARLPREITFHTLDHTHEVILACNLIAANEQIDQEIHEDLLLAACFHDTGFTKTHKDHASASIDIATEFLKQRTSSKHKIRNICRLIGITSADRTPKDLPEYIIRDADSFHLSKSNYQEYLLRFRMEWEYILKRNYTDKEWLLMNLNFLHEHKYYTHYAIENWEEKKMNNIGFMEKVSSLFIP